MCAGVDFFKTTFFNINMQCLTGVLRRFLAEMPSGMAANAIHLTESFYNVVLPKSIPANLFCIYVMIIL